MYVLLLAMPRLTLALFCLIAPFSVTLSAEPSEPARLAAKALLLDLARVESRLIAVGDRGHVVVSDDDGRTWTQSMTPTRAMLTGVSFATPQHGWAVGHDGVILQTQDGGRTWSRQEVGEDIETIFLDVLFLDEKRGFAVGAYGKFLSTADGGETWKQASLIEEDFHFNRISRDGAGTLYVAGEAGTLLISRDDGKTWKRSDIPYEGSLYGVLPLDSSRLIAYGLRGTILFSPDAGATWEAEPTDVKVLIMSGTIMPNGDVILAGAGGNFFIGKAGEFKFKAWKPADLGTGIAELAALGADQVVTVGEAGAVVITLP